MSLVPLVQCFVESPLGRLRLVATDAALVAVYFQDHRRAKPVEAETVARHAVLDLARRDLDEYFRGRRRELVTPYAPRGTSFQQLVWSALAAIPFGETRTYAGIARAIGRPRAARAVGAANAMNPVSVFVPCHRVMGGDGSLTGYAGGIDRKRWLLEHERAVAANHAESSPQAAAAMTATASAASAASAATPAP